jgi:PAS domain S-box-containing protein
MSPGRRKPKRSPTLRELAQARLGERTLTDLDALEPAEIRELVHELEVHKVELQIQNEQLMASQLAAEESKERYRELYDSAPIGLVEIDGHGMIVESNLSFAALLGFPRSQIIGRKLSSYVAPMSQDRWHLERHATERTIGHRTFELEFACQDGSTLHAQLMCARREAEQAAGDPLRLSVFDVTELRKAERALRKAALTISLTEQRERRKLASDLHDNLGQLLSLALLKLHALNDSTAAGRSPAIREIEELLTQTSGHISTMSFELSPPLLYDLGLGAATQWLAEDLERRYGLVVKLVRVDDLPLDECASITLYRAMREFLINVVKHAGVRTARVWIRRDGEMGRVTVEDSGSGIHQRPNEHGRGFGLLALHQRLCDLGGSLEVGAAPGGGTRAVASVPILQSTAR